MTAVLLFPGQSSRRPGMLASAEALAPDINGPLLDAACQTLDRDLRAWDKLDPEEAFALNRDVQVGVFVASHLHLQALEARGVQVSASAGLSLGEYNHLVHIGALTFLEALKVVECRGEAYDRGPSGVMAAVFPASVEEVEEVLAKVDGFVAVSNRNSPTQQVIAGESEAVEVALAMLEDELFVSGRVIEKRIPMHTAQFSAAADLFRPALEAAPWRSPGRTYVPNVLGVPVSSPTPLQIVELLSRHVYQAVRWRETIDGFVRANPDVVFVEVGPATVVHDLLQRSWVAAPRGHTADLIALAESVEVIRE